MKPVSIQPLEDFTDLQLLQLWAKVMAELRERGVTRSSNNPIGDYCERVVAASYGVEPVGGSHAGYDLMTRDGLRVQVNGRRITSRSRPSHYSFIRNLDEHEFDLLIAVLFNEDFTVKEAWELSWEAVKRHARYVEHVNGWRLRIVKGEIAEDPGVRPLALRDSP